MKQHCIKITVTVLVPFDPDRFGSTGEAEAAAQKLEADLRENEAFTIDRFQAKKVKVDAE